MTAGIGELGDDELVLIHRAKGGPGVAALLKSLLESEGIGCVIKSESGTIAFSMMPPLAGLPLVSDGPLGLFDVFVLDRDAERGREILAGLDGGTDPEQGSGS